MQSMKVRISLEAKNLQNTVGAFKGSSGHFYAVVTLLGKDPCIIGKTGVIKNSNSPNWLTTFKIDCAIGEPTNILIKIYDEVLKGDDISVGSALFDVRAVLGAKGNTIGKRVKGDRGTIFVKAEKIKNEKRLKLKMSGIKLKNTEGFLRKSDPFYEFSKKVRGPTGEEWDVVHRSQYIMNDLSPNWPAEEIDIDILCGGNFDEILLMRVYDRESSGAHVLMGEAQITINSIIDSRNSVFDVTKKGRKTGFIAVHKAEVIGEVSVLDHIRNSLKIKPSMLLTSSSRTISSSSVGKPEGKLQKQKKLSLKDYILGLEFCGVGGKYKPF